MPTVAAFLGGVIFVRAVAPSNSELGADYLQGYVVPVVVPVHAGLLREAHERMLVGFLATLEV